MKRSLTEYMNNHCDDYEEQQIVKKMARSCEDMKEQCRHAASFEDCVEELLRGVAFPLKQDENLHQLTDFIQATDFWEDMLHMGMESNSSDDSSSDVISIEELDQQREWEAMTKLQCYRDIVRNSSNSKLAVVITDTSSPFSVLHVNAAWERLCGFTKDEIVGKSLSITQGPDTCRETVEEMVGHMKNMVDNSDEYEVKADIFNYKKNGKRFCNRIQVRPLRNPAGRVAYFIGFLQEISPVGQLSQQLLL